jgi:hypothetical protein
MLKRNPTQGEHHNEKANEGIPWVDLQGLDGALEAQSAGSLDE